MKINGTTTETIEDGASIRATAKMGLTTVLKTTYRICELDGVECPLTLDKEEVAITFDLGTTTAVYRTTLLTNFIGFRLTICLSSDGLHSQHSRGQLRQQSIDVYRRICYCEIAVQKGGKQDILMVDLGRMQSPNCSGTVYLTCNRHCNHE